MRTRIQHKTKFEHRVEMNSKATACSTWLCVRSSAIPESSVFRRFFCYVASHVQAANSRTLGNWSEPRATREWGLCCPRRAADTPVSGPARHHVHDGRSLGGERRRGSGGVEKGWVLWWCFLAVFALEVMTVSLCLSLILPFLIVSHGLRRSSVRYLVVSSCATAESGCDYCESSTQQTWWCRAWCCEPRFRLHRASKQQLPSPQDAPQRRLMLRQPFLLS